MKIKTIEIYTKATCPFCRQAKNLLMAKNVSYKEIDIVGNSQKRTKMVQRSGGKTSVPQIFVEGELIGGCEELYALEEKGKLDQVLGI